MGKNMWKMPTSYKDIKRDNKNSGFRNGFSSSVEFMTFVWERQLVDVDVSDPKNSDLKAENHESLVH